MNTASKIVKIIVTESTLMAVFAVVVLIFSKKANFAQFEGNHCAFLFILTYNSEILCKFDYCETRFIDLVLSKDQKVMNDGEAEGRYCWTADIITDYDLSDEHVSKKFLGYEFKSITCRYKFE